MVWGQKEYYNWTWKSLQIKVNRNLRPNKKSEVKFIVFIYKKVYGFCIEEGGSWNIVVFYDEISPNENY